MSKDFDCDPADCSKIDEAIEHCEHKFHSMFDLINDGLLILDQHGHVVDLNRTACDHLGYSKEQVLGLHLAKLIAPDHVAHINEQVERLATRGHATFESAHLHRNGHTIPIEINVRRIELKGEPILFSVVRDLSERKRVEHRLQLMQRSVDRMGDGAFWVRSDGAIAYANQAACHMLGYTRDELLKLSVFDFDTAMHQSRWQAHWENARVLGSRTLESIHLTKQGQEIPVEITANHFTYENEEYHCTFVRDITVRRQAQRALKMMQFAMDNMSDAVCWFNSDGKIVYANIAASRLLDHTLDEMLSMHIQDFRSKPDQAGWNDYWQALQLNRTNTEEVFYRSRGGHTFPVEIVANHMQYEGEEYVCAFIRDITTRKLSEEKFARLAHYDALTGLPNRALLYDRLEQAIAQASRYRQKLAVLFLDLDGFKKVNDNYGHYVGDDLLRAVADKLRECARATDTVARVGGDEFIFIINEVSGTDNAALVARKILECLNHPFVIHSKPCPIGGSIGIAMFPDDTCDLEELVKRADDAMYVAKNNGKGNYQFCNQPPLSQSSLNLD